MKAHRFVSVDGQRTGTYRQAFGARREPNIDRNGHAYERKFFPGHPDFKKTTPDTAGAS